MKQKFQVHIKRKASSLRMSKDFMSFSLASIIFFPWVLINNMTMTLFSETKEQNPCGGWDLSSLSTWPQSNLKLYQYNSQPLKQQPHMQHRMRNERKKLKNKLIQSHYESHSSINLKCMWQLASKIPLSLSLAHSLSLCKIPLPLHCGVVHKEASCHSHAAKCATLMLPSGLLSPLQVLQLFGVGFLSLECGVNDCSSKKGKTEVIILR